MLPVRIAGPPDQIPPYGQLSGGPLNEVSRPRALSLPITVSSHAKSSSPLPFVSGVSDRRPEQIRHQKTSYGGEHSSSRGCHPTGCAVVVTGDLPQTANVLPPQRTFKSFSAVRRLLKQCVFIRARCLRCFVRLFRTFCPKKFAPIRPMWK